MVDDSLLCFHLLTPPTIVYGNLDYFDLLPPLQIILPQEEDQRVVVSHPPNQ